MVSTTLWECNGSFDVCTLHSAFPIPADIDSVDPSNDLTLFANVMEAMERCSPDASIFILIHKMDLVAEDDREREFAERSALVQSKSEQ